MSEIILPFSPRRDNPEEGYLIVQQNVEALSSLIQRGANDGDTLIWDSASGRFLAQAPAVQPMSMELIEEKILGADAASMVFSSIPQTYKGLHFNYSVAGATAAKATLLWITANAFSNGSDYLFRNEGGKSYDSKWVFGNIPAATLSPNWGTGFFECYGYTLARKQGASGIYEAYIDNSGTASTDYASGVSSCHFPVNTTVAALTSFTFAAATGNLVSGSRISLWGIK